MNTIHQKWLRPMPHWYQDWSYRDDNRIGEHPPFAPDPKKPEPRTCDACGMWYRPATVRSVYCKSPACQKEKHRKYWARANDKRSGGAA